LVTEEVADLLDESLKALDGDVDIDIGVHENANPEEVGDLDMAVLGPDGTAFEDVHNLSQMESGDTLLGGPLMDHTVDPFAVNLHDDESAEGALAAP
jgi:hypothetical protein